MALVCSKLILSTNNGPKRHEFMKIAFYFQQNNTDAQATARNMAQAQCLAGHQQVFAIALGPHSALGCVHTATSASKIPFLYQAANGNVLAISGVPIDMQLNTAAKLKSIIDKDYGEAARILASFDGAFAALFWDNVNRKLVVVTDFLGYQPLYIHQDAQTLLFASEMKGMMASGKVALENDPAFWGGFFYLGNGIADTTSVKGIRKTQAGCVYTFDPALNQLRKESYFQWPVPRRKLKLSDIDFDAFLEILTRNMKAYAQYSDEAAMLLSGGYDSRMMLALLVQNGMKVKSLVVDHPDELDNLDGQLAIEVTRRLGVPYAREIPDRHFYSSLAYWDYLVKNEIVTPSLYLFIANLTPFVTPRMGAVWEGLSIGLSVSLMRHGHHSFESYFGLNLKMEGTPIYRVVQSVFKKGSFEAMNEAFLHALRAERNKYSNDGYGVYEFALRNWTRNRVAHSPYSVLSNNVLTFTPGHCREFISLLAEVPIEYKLHAILIDEVYKRHLRHVADIPVCSGGKMHYPLGHKPVKFKLLEQQNRVMQNRLVRGLSRRLGRAEFCWDESQILKEVLSRLDGTDQEINLGTLKNGQSGVDSFRGKEIIFYRQMMRWIVSGEHQKYGADIFKGRAVLS